MYKNIKTFLWQIYISHLELAIAISSVSIVLLAVIMDKFMYLQACPMCILTRYIFGLVALSATFGVFFKYKIFVNLLIIISSVLGMLLTSRQIYIQNMSVEGLSNLSGCGMPLSTQIEYFGIVEALKKTISGGPSCAEDGWRFILNFAEWGLLFFLIFVLLSFSKIISTKFL